jgi:hypothetical protein
MQPVDYAREMKIYVHTKTCTWMLIAAFFINNQKVETHQMSFNGKMVKQTLVHLPHGI